MQSRLSPILSMFTAVCGSVLWAAVGAARLKADDPNRPSTRPPTGRQLTPSLTFSAVVRVNLTPVPVRKLRVAVNRPFRIRPVGARRVIDRVERWPSTDVVATADGFRIGRNRYRASRLEIIPDESPSIWVGRHQYRGIVRLYRQPEGKLIAVNEVPLEPYIASVVDGEMPLSFPAAARQAQAIVARTYALFRIEQARHHPHFDLYATTRSQRYLGFQYRDANGRRLAGESASSRRIADLTKSMVCLDRGRLFATYYSAVCGGRTTAGSEVFPAAVLKSVPCDWCRESPLFRWMATLKKPEAVRSFRRYFASQGKPFDGLVSFRPVCGGVSQRHPHFDVSDGANQYRVAAADLRRRIFPSLLHSPRFTVRTDQEGLVFEGRGHGHGVGMCQWGARGLALAGRDALQIIAHYYPGAQVVKLEATQR